MHQRSGKEKAVTGFAVIQKVITGKPNLVVEADGYRMSIPSSATIQYQAPLTSASTVAPNWWISYTGKFGKDGLLVDNQATFSQFVFSAPHMLKTMHDEEKFVPPDYATKKNGTVNLGYGIKGTLPADQKINERLRQIGERLIPTCQRDLESGNLQKINFQFYAFDNKHIRAAVASQDGKILVPVQTVARMQTDDQLSAVLANGIAQALEWQPLRDVFSQSNQASAMMAVGGLPFIGPLAGIALESGGLYAAHHAQTSGQALEQQRARVGLSLMHDAGYDVFQAPTAWQILMAKDVKKIGTKQMPQQSLYMWEILSKEYLPGSNAVIASNKTNAGSK